MKKCKRIKKLLIPFYLGELPDKENDLVKNHLDICEICLKEYKKLEKLFEGIEENRKEVEKAVDSIDWEQVPLAIMKRLEKESVPEKRKYSFQILNLKPALSIPVSLFLIIGITLLFILHPWSRKHVSENEFLISSSSFQNMESSLAKKEAIDYLKQSQLLLMDLMKFSSPEEIDLWTINFNSRKAKNLLIKKKYFDEKLDNLNLMKAKRICNQIEFLFYDVIQLKEQPDFENIRKIQRIIEKEQLLFRIRLIEKELS